MKKVMFFLVVAILATACNAQDDNDSKNIASSEQKSHQMHVFPKGSWKVTKEVDEHGNIIKYDSIYSWSSSHYASDIHSKEADSLLKAMESMMQRHFSFNDLSKGFGFRDTDSIMNKFFSNSESFDAMPFGFRNFDEMRQHMEAFRRQFFNDRNRYIIPPEKMKTDSTAMRKQSF